jgi:hypothetical protein
MTREDCIKVVFNEFKEHGIVAEKLTEWGYRIKVRNKMFMLSFYELSFTVTAYWSTRERVDHKLMSMDFFYNDVSLVWVSGMKLFVQSGYSYVVVALGKNC